VEKAVELAMDAAQILFLGINPAALRTRPPFGCPLEFVVEMIVGVPKIDGAMTLNPSSDIRIVVGVTGKSDREVIPVTHFSVGLHNTEPGLTTGTLTAIATIGI